MTPVEYETYRQAKEQIAQLESELSEFRTTSAELEKEMELELEEAEAKQNALQDQVSTLTGEVSSWKRKYLDLQKEYAASQTSLQKEISKLRAVHVAASERLRDIETCNDDMERRERIIESSLQDLEHKYHDALEQVALLECDIATRKNIQNNLEMDLQRSKIELTETREELDHVNSKLVEISSSSSDKENKSPQKETSNIKHLSIGIPPNGPRPLSIGIPPNGPQPPPSIPRLSSSRSIRRIHGMLDQVRSLETRVASFRSSLPRPITPTKSSSPRNAHSAQSSPRSSPSPSPTTASGATSNIPVSRFRKSNSNLNLHKLADSHPSTDTNNGNVNDLRRNPSGIKGRSAFSTPELEPIEKFPSGSSSKSSIVIIEPTISSAALGTIRPKNSRSSTLGTPSLKHQSTYHPPGGSFLEPIDGSPGDSTETKLHHAKSKSSVGSFYHHIKVPFSFSSKGLENPSKPINPVAVQGTSNSLRPHGHSK